VSVIRKSGLERQLEGVGILQRCGEGRSVECRATRNSQRFRNGLVASMERHAPALPVTDALWALSDGHAGNVRQAVALASALGEAPVEQVVLQPSLAARAFAPRRYPLLARPFGRDFATGPVPKVAIGCGRQAALATRLLRERGSRAVQILDPRIAPAHWDLVIAPEHDRLRGANVIHTLGSLHPVDDAWLADARTRFAAFAELPQPRTAVLLGGSSRHVRFDRMAFEVLAANLEAVLARDGGSVLVTISRRTPRELREALRRRFAETPGLTWLGEEEGPNPYAGLLAWADRIVCSPDSVNMVSEACATRVPVFVFDPQRAGGRVRMFLDSLLQRGRIRAMAATLDPFEVEPLRETTRVAEAVRQRLDLNG
jgi:mitochondrial fission protein ELM1